ncbi:LacI family DNA-binding transcriptional regulator [Croceitalea marina]|uniref:LacI family DNA-binding transcriptional regulator n=2 Tax=Croceitalea marina TaxID=1775166 RepID=A0ABW5N2R2_9FLAO
MKMYKNNKPTLRDIARALDLTVPTVSKALRNYDEISDKTKESVVALAEAWNYEPNAMALKLRTKKTMVLGVLVSQISNLFYESFLSALEEYARSEGYTLMILQSFGAPKEEFKNLEILKRNDVDAVFVSLSSKSCYISEFIQLHEMGTPIIYFNNVPKIEHCIKITFDGVKIGQMAARAMIINERKKILSVFLNSDSVEASDIRLQAFEEKLKKEAPLTTLKVERCRNLEDVEQLIASIFRKNKESYDAVFCLNDTALIGTIYAFKKLDVDFQKVSVLSVSNGLVPSLFNPLITYIETNGYKLGKRSFERFLDYQNGNTAYSNDKMDVCLKGDRYKMVVC